MRRTDSEMKMLRTGPRSAAERHLGQRRGYSRGERIARHGLDVPTNEESSISLTYREARGLKIRWFRVQVLVGPPKTFPCKKEAQPTYGCASFMGTDLTAR